MNTFPTTTRRESFADGLTVRVDERGSGRPILVLHGGGGSRTVTGFSEALAEQAHVLSPIHPGFDGEPRPEWFNGVDSLALAYLELLERLDLQDVTVIGFSFGGWIAAEMAARNTTRLGGIVLVDAIGIQVNGHEITDVFSQTPGGLSAGGNQPPVPPAPQSSEQDAVRAANYQTLAVYRQEQGLLNPRLRGRLASVMIPVLVVWGENDHIVDPDYGHAYAQSFPNARFELIPEAGHSPQMQQPGHLLTLVRAFMSSHQSS